MPDEPVAQTPPADPQVQPGPWEQDIRQSFTDPQVAAQVDNFLRARVQPRVTQLEQQVASTRDAQQLWEAFQNDPVGTFNVVQAQLIEAGVPIAQATAQAASVAHEAATTPSPAAAAAAQTEDPRVAEMYASYTQSRELTAYDESVASIVNDPANADINPNRLHTYVAAADGDFTQALAMYRADTAQVLLDYGIDPATATRQQQEAASAVAETAQRENVAPPVMGQAAGGAGASMPAQPEYRGQDGLHRAIEEAAAAAFRKAAPPVV